ncbi:acetate and sugar kinases/Hsc70/actin family protein [Endozoicomonas euniceicola]|uniref:Uncharacterized protein n=1 Tax=Endozoicomonas euniceicola TaxID=1234143 RepID=A0ABY6GMH6_9GAMM|nr:hypothetical protein [Endozoicomonas euniceicola]UYM13940.1 hypothetical protein NX720_13540 [Endozoicomonas euniceicola]
MLLLPLRLFWVFCKLKGKIAYLNFFSALPKKLQHLTILLLLPLSFIVFAKEFSSKDVQKYQEIRKIVVLDDGSTGSRLVSFLFGRNFKHEEFRLIKQSPMHEAGVLSLENGGVDDKSAQLIAGLLKKDDCGDKCKSYFFLGATAGRRADEESARKMFRMIREKLKQLGINEKKYDIEMKVLDGSMEGAYNWLAVNYIYGRLDHSEQSYGIVELGGKSAQLAFSLKTKIDTDDTVVLKNKILHPEKSEDKALLSFEHGLIQKNNNEVITESKMGFGLNLAYKNYEQKFAEAETRPCERRHKNYFECQQAMDSLFSKEDDESKHAKRLFWRSDEEAVDWRMPDTYYLSGYFYDYTVHMGLRSHLTLRQLEEAAKYACQDRNETDDGTNLLSTFETELPQPVKPRVVTKPSDFQYSGSIQEINRERFCGTLTYMVSLLKHFGIKSNHNLVIVKSFVLEGKPYPATWTPGYAYAKANEYEINHKISTTHPFIRVNKSQFRMY